MEETNRAARDEDINTKFTTNTDEILRYFGILIYMSVYRYPNIESYWGKNAFPPIANAMTGKRFKEIKRYLSFQGESQRVKKGAPGYDPLFAFAYWLT